MYSNNIGSKICASVNQKLKNCARQDMAISDYRMIDKSHAQVLIAYASAKPSIEEIAKFIAVSFRGDAFPVFETCCAYDQNKVVGITLAAKQLSRSMEDCPKMAKITASTFIDVNDGAEWHVTTNPTTGAKYLARALEEDFESIVSAHKASRDNCSFVTAETHFDKVCASYLDANENDFVKFFSGTMQCGTVKQVLPDGELKIVNDLGEVYVVPKTSVIQIIRKDPEEQALIKNDMINFYSNIFGKEYAEQLLKYGPTV